MSLLSLHPAWLAAVPAMIAGVAWLDLAWLPILLVVPWVILSQKHRAIAFASAWGYYAAFSRDLPEAYAKFYPAASSLWGWLGWAFWAATLALPWVFLIRRNMTPERKAISILVALTALTVPPFGFFHWGSPLLAGGALYPGMGVLGLLATAALAATFPLWRKKTALATLACLLALSVAANTLWTTPARPEGWVAINTEMGRHPPIANRTEVIGRQEALYALATEKLSEEGIKVILFPESIAGMDRAAIDFRWRPLSKSLADNGGALLMGVDIWDGSKGYLNALKEPGGKIVARARVPMPAGSWKFGLAPGAFSDVFGSGTVNVAGRKASVSFCYEDFILWPHLELLTWQTEVLLAPGNQWSSKDLAAENTQNVSLAALGRLAGVPVLRARNR
ncbi:MAG: hypothetical protein LC131_02550 [Anaerolineae bacterium]|nr:hypothetical protein [Anaerolineae bacterium]